MKRELKKTGDALLQNCHSLFDAGGFGFLFKQLQGFVHRLVGKPEGTVMHGHHPAGVEIEEGANSVGRVGVHVAERRRVIRANGQQSDVGGEALADFAKAGEVRGVAGMIDRVLVIADDVAAVTAMRIFDNARAPMTGRNMGDGQGTMAVAVPPVELDDVAETKIGNQVENMMRDDDRRR